MGIVYALPAIGQGFHCARRPFCYNNGMPRELPEEERAPSLAEGDARMRAFTELLPFPFMICDKDGTIEFLNRAWEKLTGYSIADIPTLADWELKAFGAPELSFIFSEGERQFLTKDKELLVWDFYSIPLGPRPNGRSAYLRTAVDLTARRRAEWLAARTPINSAPSRRNRLCA